MKAEQFKTLAKQVQTQTPKEVIESSGGFNSYLMQLYRRQTGQTDFRTFKQWKAAGYSVKKGESSYPIFSRPINTILAEQGKQTTTEGKYFGTCHLFHSGQVQPIEPK